MALCVHICVTCFVPQTETEEEDRQDVGFVEDAGDIDARMVALRREEGLLCFTCYLVPKLDKFTYCKLR